MALWGGVLILFIALQNRKFRLRPSLNVAPTQTQNSAIKAEGAGHSGSMSKPDNEEIGILGRVRLGPFKRAASLFTAYLGPQTSRLTPCFALK